MPAYFIDSVLWGDLFSTAELRAIFDDRAYIQRVLDAEAALAEAEAELGLIPAAAAAEIRLKARVENVDLGAIKAEFDRIRHQIMPVVHALARACEGGAGEYVHWGATTQDIVDTATVLQLKDALQVFYRDLREIEAELIRLAETHAATPMAGRTHGQQALPVTLGYKFAVWAAEIRRHIERLKEAAPRVLVGQLGGAVGTFASFGAVGPEVRRRMLAKLGLGEPEICWHSARDRFAEVNCLLGLIAATLYKVGNEIYQLQKTEIDELEEPFTPGKVGSSTMPHKRNPSLAENLKAVADKIRHNVAQALAAASPEHERDAAAWWAERLALAENCLLMGAALFRTKQLLSGLTVRPDRMARNLRALGDLLLSEAVMLRAAEKLGRQTAHEVVYRAAMRAYEAGGSLKAELLAEPELAGLFTEADLDRLLDPAGYIGLAPQVVAEVAAKLRAARAADPGTL
jgi:adenylosuccinate lyase